MLSKTFKLFGFSIFWFWCYSRIVWCTLSYISTLAFSLSYIYIISSKLHSDRLSLFGRSVNSWKVRLRLSLFGRSVNCWRVSALARTLQLFTDRPNNDRRSRELRTFLYDVADLWLETVTKFFPRTIFDGLSWKF